MGKTTLLFLVFLVLIGLCLSKPSSSSRSKMRALFPLKRSYKRHQHALYVRELASKYEEKRFEDCVDSNPYECMYQMFVEPANCDATSCAFSCNAC